MSTQMGKMILKASESTSVWLGGIGVDFKIGGEQTGGSFAVVEHPIEPGRLVPPHVHHNVDEYSYVLEGRIGARIGDEMIDAEPGAYVFKPRNVPHTFWNPGPEPARLIEIIAPAGFERFFAELAELIRTSTSEELRARRAALGVKYRTDFVGGWTAELKRAYGLKLIGE